MHNNTEARSSTVNWISFCVLPQQVFAQIGASEQMMQHMRFTHSQLTNNVDEVKQLLKANNTSETINLLDGGD